MYKRRRAVNAIYAIQIVRRGGGGRLERLDKRRRRSSRPEPDESVMSPLSDSKAPFSSSLGGGPKLTGRRRPQHIRPCRFACGPLPVIRAAREGFGALSPPHS